MAGVQDTNVIDLVGEGPDGEVIMFIGDRRPARGSDAQSAGEASINPIVGVRHRTAGTCTAAADRAATAIGWRAKSATSEASGTD